AGQSARAGGGAARRGARALPLPAVGEVDAQLRPVGLHPRLARPWTEDQGQPQARGRHRSAELFVMQAFTIRHSLSRTLASTQGSFGGSRPSGRQERTSAVTRPTPGRPMARAAPVERSSTRPRTNGPRSLIVTTTLRSRWVTRSLVPNGRDRCAAVMAFWLKRWPDAVRLPDSLP